MHKRILAAAATAVGIVTLTPAVSHAIPVVEPVAITNVKLTSTGLDLKVGGGAATEHFDLTAVRGGSAPATDSQGGISNGGSAHVFSTGDTGVFVLNVVGYKTAGVGAPDYVFDSFQAVAVCNAIGACTVTPTV